MLSGRSPYRAGCHPLPATQLLVPSVRPCTLTADSRKKGCPAATIPPSARSCSSFPCSRVGQHRCLLWRGIVPGWSEGQRGLRGPAFPCEYFSQTGLKGVKSNDVQSENRVTGFLSPCSRAWLREGGRTRYTFCSVKSCEHARFLLPTLFRVPPRLGERRPKPPRRCDCCSQRC